MKNLNDNFKNLCRQFQRIKRFFLPQNCYVFTVKTPQFGSSVIRNPLQSPDSCLLYRNAPPNRFKDTFSKGVRIRVFIVFSKYLPLSTEIFIDKYAL